MPSVNHLSKATKRMDLPEGILSKRRFHRILPLMVGWHRVPYRRNDGVIVRVARFHNIAGPLGVRGRNSDNRLIAQNLGWKPTRPLIERP
jgi:hypothetical protein